MGENNCSNCANNKIVEEMKKILEKYPQEKDMLITILNDVQVRFGYIPQMAQMEISKYLRIPMAEIYGVITFYSRFTLKPKGKYNLSVCLSNKFANALRVFSELSKPSKP